MRKIAVKIPPLYRRGLFFVLFISWCTGIGFFILSHWITVDGPFGPEKHPWQYPALQIHGAAAFFMLMAFGSIIASHLPMSWKTRRLRVLGILMISALSLQIIGAYLLYYLSNEDIRFWVANFHAALGLTLPAILFTHITVGIKTRGQR